MPKRKIKTGSREKLQGCQTKLHPHGRLLPLEDPDVSSILKIAGTEQAEEPDDLFDPPLHSTAVSAYEEDENQSLEVDEVASNSSDFEPKKKNKVQSKSHHTLTSRREREDCEEELLKENVMPRKNAKFQAKEKEMFSSEMDTDHSDSEEELHLVKVCNPKGAKKVSSRVTRLDVILHKFEKITAKYIQEVDKDTCKKVIDRFYTSFKDQLTNNDKNTEELRKIKLKNMKMMRVINKERKRLLDVQEELIKTEPQLKKLVKEYGELKRKRDSLRNAVQLVTDLKDLQQKYINYRQENPQEEIGYGVSSLPALLVDSQRILGAESHFRTINSKLQEMMDSHQEN